MIKINIYIIIFISTCFVGCSIHTAGTKKNEEIDQETRANIGKIVSEIIQSFQIGNLDNIKNKFADGMLTQSDLLDTTMALRLLTKESKITTLDEFKVTNPSSSGTNKVNSTLHGQEYEFSYHYFSNESYICLLSIENPSEDCKLLLSLLFTEGKNSWELQYMYISPYTYKDNIAPYFSDLAHEQDMNNNIIGAYLNAEAANYLATPSSYVMHYQNDREILELYQEISKKFNDVYRFPIILNKLSSKPKINSLSALVKLNKVAPTRVVNYDSRILDNIMTMEKENQQLHSEIENIFPGISSVSDSVIYEVSYMNNNNNAETKVITKALGSIL